MQPAKITHSVEQLQPARFAEATAILHECLGTDCNLPAEYPSPRIAIFGHFLDDTLAGVGTAEIKLDGGGLLANMAVLPKYQGNGIGTSLVAARVEWLRSLGVQYVVAEAWASNDRGVNAAKPLVRNGFWLTEVRPLHFGWCRDCPSCRPASCGCGAFIYRKVLRDA